MFGGNLDPTGLRCNRFSDPLQALRHKSVERVVMVDIDQVSILFCLHQGLGICLNKLMARLGDCLCVRATAKKMKLNCSNSRN